MKDSSSLSTFVSKTLHSSARFTETERRRAPFLLLLSLSVLCSFTSFAWDDDDDTDHGYKNAYQSKIQNPQSRITPTSSIDYGYKNPYQGNSTHRASAIDFGGPKRLAQANDDNDSKPFSQSTRAVSLPRPASGPQLQENTTYTSPQQTYEANRVRALHVSTVDESVALRDRESREIMAESQRHFEKQEAQQERNHAQMAKQQEIYDEMDQEECEMAEFLGGVYKATFGATTGRNSAVTTDGYVYRSGNNFITPKGIYTKTGNTYAGPDSFTTQTGTLFFGNNPTTIQAGGAYFSEGESGYIVSPNCRNTSTWRSR